LSFSREKNKFEVWFKESKRLLLIFLLQTNHILFILRWLRSIFSLKCIKNEVYPNNCIYDNAFSFCRHPDMHSSCFFLSKMLSSECSIKLRSGAALRNKHDWSSLSLLLSSSSSLLWTCCCYYSRQFSLLFFYRQ
jgi:hypothetical protein